MRGPSTRMTGGAGKESFTRPDATMWSPVQTLPGL
jgi:hypothetical protein